MAVGSDKTPNISISRNGWRIVAVACGVCALGLLVAILAQDGLFESSTSSHPEALTTLALVLAILAFLVQLFVFIFQTNASGSAVQRSEELDAQTQTALKKIEASSEATQKVLFAQFDRLLDYVVGEASPSTETPPVAEEDTSENAQDEGARPATVSDLREAMSEVANRPPRPVFAARPASRDKRAIEHLTTWPPTREAGEEAVRELQKLSPLAVAQLMNFMRIELQQARVGPTKGLRANPNGPSPPVVELIDAGLVERDEQWSQLTPRGRDAIRMLPFAKQSNRPDWWEELVAPLLKHSNVVGNSGHVNEPSLHSMPRREE